MCNHGSVNCVVVAKSFIEKADEAEREFEVQAVVDRTVPTAAKKQKTHAWASSTIEFELQAVVDRKERFKTFLAHVELVEHRRQRKSEKFGQIWDPLKLSQSYSSEFGFVNHRHGGY